MGRLGEGGVLLALSVASGRAAAIGASCTRHPQGRARGGMGGELEEGSSGGGVELWLLRAPLKVILSSRFALPWMEAERESRSRRE
jgi:hypothetical protein